MMTIRVCVAGATGWTGSAVTRAMITSSEFQLTGAIARRQAGRDIGLPGESLIMRVRPKWMLPAGPPANWLKNWQRSPRTTWKLLLSRPMVQKKHEEPLLTEHKCILSACQAM